MKYEVFNFFKRFLRKYVKLWAYNVFFLIFTTSCVAQTKNQVDFTPQKDSIQAAAEIILPGAFAIDKYLPLLKNKHVGIVANAGSMLGKTHLVDTLLQSGIKIQTIFSPEHGFRGTGDAGESIQNSKDEKTGISMISLYGKNKKPSAAQLNGIDILVFDLQDVGVRFYTYISTLTYVMEACAENHIPLIVLDRPNPNGNYIDGPILEAKHKSFIGLHPVPVVYGMTIGEYAQMVNGEKWIDSLCDLTVIPCENYTHQRTYHLPVAPSPNLQTDNAIAWYPSLCFFEGTNVSVGRGTTAPFEQVGSPNYGNKDFSFTPEPSNGAKHPLFEGQTCYGINFQDSIPNRELNLDALLLFYTDCKDKSTFFLSNGFFELLAGTEKLRNQIVNGDDETTIRASWKQGIDDFKQIRQKYLIYR